MKYPANPMQKININEYWIITTRLLSPVWVLSTLFWLSVVVLLTVFVFSLSVIEVFTFSNFTVLFTDAIDTSLEINSAFDMYSVPFTSFKTVVYFTSTFYPTHGQDREVLITYV